MNSTLEEYLNAIRQRNNETAEDGHCPIFGEFNYPAQVIEDNLEYFKNCYKHNLSPHKALTFFRAEQNWKDEEEIN